MAKPNNAPDELSRLKQAIKAASPERLYFFHGEEIFLLHHYLNELRKKTIDPLTEDFNGREHLVNAGQGIADAFTVKVYTVWQDAAE